MLIWCAIGVEGARVLISLAENHSGSLTSLSVYAFGLFCLGCVQITGSISAIAL